MEIKCPKCHFDNPDTQHFCGECGTQLPPAEEISSPLTETLETPKEELTRGTTFADRYEIIEELGKGGMGRVYRVEDTKLEQEVALKLIKLEIAKDKKTIERFRNELKLARNIRHKNVCGMFDLGETRGAHFITMEYVRGEDLRSLIRRIGQLPIGKSISIANQICDGLAEAHIQGVVHRDLKSNNIMIDKEGNVRIMDFGIARSLETKGITGAGVMIGTPEYMSPEQVEGKEVDQRSDIYSLGVILYEMVTGRVPFEGDTPFTIGMKHKGETPKNPKELNNQISNDLNRLILRCLEKEKEKRYQSTGEVRSELTNIEKGIPTTERIVPERKPLTSREITVQFRLKKVFVPALVFIAVIIIGVVTWQLLPQKEVVSAPKIENSVAVISFENQTGDNAYDHLKKVIPNLLITNLENTGYLHVATWERMHDLLKQMGKGDVEIIDRDLGFELCRMEGIEAIVLGSYAKAGDMFATDVKVLDVDTKKLLKSASSRGKTVDSILEAQIDELSREISQGMGIAREKIEESQVRINEVTTNSIDAYNYFLRGREDYERYYHDEARLSLEKAVELDPNFAVAYLWLARAYSQLGDRKAISGAYEKAKNLSQKATEKERLYIEAAYASSVERDLEKRFSILKEIAKKYPKEKRVHYSLGMYYHGKRMYDQAIEEYNKALELDPNYGYAMNDLAYVYSDMGNYEKAIEYFKKYVAVAPGEANPHDSIAEVYFRMGRIEDAITKYKEALEIKPDFYSSLSGISYLYGLKEDYSEAIRRIDRWIDIAQSPGEKQRAYLCKGFYYSWRGNLEKCLANLQRSEELAEEVGAELVVEYIKRLKIWIYYDRGMLELSRKFNDGWIDFSVKNYPQGEKYYKADYSITLGLIELKEGKIDSAKKRLNEVESLFPDSASIDEEGITDPHDLLKAEVFLAEGFPEKCIAVLEKISPSRPPVLHSSVAMVFYNIPFLKDALPRAYKQKGDLDNAISAYERLIEFDPEKEDRFLIHPVYHYRLAKLYEEKGWEGKAIEHYEKFLDLWKDADPGIAEVEDAKKRVAELKE